MVKRILGQVRKAVQDYGMISDVDKIAVGVSGGKDSITLMLALRKLKEFYPAKFELEAVTTDAGIEGTDFRPLTKLCEEYGIRHTIEETNIGKLCLTFEKRKTPVPFAQTCEEALSTTRLFAWVATRSLWPTT
jgi:tRNA 2-thiocytidine biosynthesis protein TtcA